MPTKKRSPKKRSPKKMSRSARLKRYESVYSKALRKGGTGSASKKVRKAPKKSPRRKSTTPRKETVKVTPKKDKITNRATPAKKSPKQNSKRLTSYQKFVQTESKKTKYRNMIPKDRLVAIGAAWKKKNKKK